MAKRYKSTIASRYLRSYLTTEEDWREAERETRQARAERARKRQVKAHKRRQAGNVIRVKGYCRKPPYRVRQGSEGMPF